MKCNNKKNEEAKGHLHFESEIGKSGEPKARNILLEIGNAITNAASSKAPKEYPSYNQISISTFKGRKRKGLSDKNKPKQNERHKNHDKSNSTLLCVETIGNLTSKIDPITQEMESEWQKWRNGKREFFLNRNPSLNPLLENYQVSPLNLQNFIFGIYISQIFKHLKPKLFTLQQEEEKNFSVPNLFTLYKKGKCSYSRHVRTHEQYLDQLL